MNGDYTRLRRQFAIAVVLAVVVMIALGGVITIANRGHHRPEGAAERWLSAVSDTTRKGVRADAVKRATKIGPLQLAAGLVPSDTDGKGAFPDLEVGNASVTGVDARVPYRLHKRALHGSNPLVAGTIVLQRSGADWNVVALDGRRPTEKVPSEGGQPPSSAPIGLWIGAVAFGALVTLVITVLVQWATRSSQRALAAS